jgi:hypothetical protein
VPTRGLTPAETLAYVSELAQHFALGELGSRAGISGASTLRSMSTDELVKLALALDVDPEELAGLAVVPESGQLANVGQLAARAFAALRANAGRVVKAASAHQGLLLTVGGVWTLHDWATMDERIAIEGRRQLAELVAPSWNALSPDERAKYRRAFLGELGGGIGLGTVALAALGVGGALLAWRWYQGRR